VVKYTEDHTCGDPEPVLDEDIIDELSNMFNSNPELTTSNAYKSLLMRKIGEGKSYKEIMNLVHCFTFDHHSKNIKASVKNAMQPGSDDLTSVMALKRFIKDTPELDLILKVAVDSYICEGCNKYRLYFSEDEETDDSCDCTQTMVNVGPIILVTSKLQVKAAFEMSDKNGLFKFSTLYLDNQNGRIINYNTLNAFFYDYQMQSISSIFTVHSKFEDKFSIALSFDLFNDIYKDVLNIADDFSLMVLQAIQLVEFLQHSPSFLDRKSDTELVSFTICMGPINIAAMPLVTEIHKLDICDFVGNYWKQQQPPNLSCFISIL
jgi:hypothetical protein